MNNSRDEHHEQWYTLDTDKEIFKNMELRLKQMEERQQELDQKVKEMDNHIRNLTHDNLKLVNRLLEAEISLERAKNSLVRNHIPFPFSSTLLTRKLGM
jgi:dynactin complex subunit